jgi:hypothetical protein
LVGWLLSGFVKTAIIFPARRRKMAYHGGNVLSLIGLMVFYPLTSALIVTKVAQGQQTRP